MDSALLARAGPAFSEWQHRLAIPARELDRKGGAAALRERQERLLAALEAGAAPLGACLREAAGLEPGERIGAPPFPRPALSPGEFPDLPAELELEIAAAWDGIVQPGPASRPLFWLLCHIEWIEQERFGADVLPAFFTDPGKDPDERTRAFLRRSGGIYVRGTVSAHSDCPLSRAWWRTRIAKEAASDPGAEVSAEQAHAVLRASRQVWEKFVELALKRVTAISQPRARAALIAALARRGEVTPGAVQAIAQALARHGLVRSLQHTDWGELHAIAAGADGAQAPARSARPPRRGGTAAGRAPGGAMAEVPLSGYGPAFATRMRADAIAAAIPAAGRIVLDFEGVLAATAGFLDGLIGALAERDADIGLTGMTPWVEQLAARIVERRGLGSRFRFLSTA